MGGENLSSCPLAYVSQTERGKVGRQRRSGGCGPFLCLNPGLVPYQSELEKIGGWGMLSLAPQEATAVLWVQLWAHTAVCSVGVQGCHVAIVGAVG